MLHTYSLKRLKLFSEPLVEVTKMSFEKRMEKSKSQEIKQLFKIMIDKQSNLCLAVDVTKSEEILTIGESYESFVHKRELVKYQSQGELNNVMP